MVGLLVPRRVAQPAVRARASIAACLPEHLSWRRVSGWPLSRHSFAPRVASGSCGPHAPGRPSLEPQRGEHARRDGEMLGLAAVRGAGDWRAPGPHCSWSNPPDAMNGIT